MLARLQPCYCHHHFHLQGRSWPPPLSPSRSCPSSPALNFSGGRVPTSYLTCLALAPRESKRQCKVGQLPPFPRDSLSTFSAGLWHDRLQQKKCPKASPYHQTWLAKAQSQYLYCHQHQRTPQMLMLTSLTLYNLREVVILMPILKIWKQRLTK